ncbi:MAG: hypothetical protein BA874_07370 [Desulfuromonadales bacterium C00003068]|jgi:predicted Fe-Mo cluster-binding NifX family protein|nr:hypothetical protein [Deltaproteobacteria bacterium]OEU69827.1 MAG: hypothetical protein BA874_07370 [Desulfuromonadales bacterium C00003068]
MFCKKMPLYFLLIFFGLMTICWASAGEQIEPMIAVAASSQEEGAVISDKAARTAHFLFYDGKGVYLGAEENPLADAARKAGPKVASFLYAKGVTFVVAGEFGTNMEDALSSYGIKYVMRTGGAHEAVQALIEEK